MVYYSAHESEQNLPSEFLYEDTHAHAITICLVNYASIQKWK